MTGEETAAAAHLAGRAAAGVTTIVEGVHRAVSDRVERLTGRPAAPIHAVQEVVSTGVYAAVRGGFSLASRGAGVIAAGRAGGTSARDSLLVAALNGAAGGLLADEANPWALELRVRPAEPRTGKLAILLHGLGESDASWKREPDYRTVVAELGWTPVLVRYNSGRRIEQNGVELSRQLEQLTATWPVPVEDIALIGHSMGGLVACSAVLSESASWVGRTSRLVTLGTPHEGAPLARLGHRARGWLGLLPETRPFDVLLDFGRAPGIDDLRHGAVTDGPWPEHVRVVTIGATLHRSPQHLVSRVLGDLLVTLDSATSAVSGRRRAEDAVHLGGLHHFHLLGHPEVSTELRARLS